MVLPARHLSTQRALHLISLPELTPGSVVPHLLVESNILHTPFRASYLFILDEVSRGRGSI